MGQILLCISQKAQLQQYSVRREGWEEQRKGLWCSQLLCATVAGKASTSIDQNSLWTSQSYWSFKNQTLSLGAHTPQSGVQNRRLH